MYSASLMWFKYFHLRQRFEAQGSLHFFGGLIDRFKEVEAQWNEREFGDWEPFYRRAACGDHITRRTTQRSVKGPRCLLSTSPTNLSGTYLKPQRQSLKCPRWRGLRIVVYERHKWQRSTRDGNKYWAAAAIISFMCLGKKKIKSREREEGNFAVPVNAY